MIALCSSCLEAHYEWKTNPHSHEWQDCKTCGRNKMCHILANADVKVLVHTLPAERVEEVEHKNESAT